MYHCGGERGWHRGHQQRDIPPPRNHHPRPYRGGYHDHREHDNYGPYHDNSGRERNYHDSHVMEGRDRNYHDNQVVEYPDHSYPEYYEENQSFNEYREHREPAYRGGRHDSGFHKEIYYRGGYRGRGKPTRYRGGILETPQKKPSPKSVKSHKKIDDIYVRSSTPQPVKKVSHNPGPTIVTLTPGITEDASETKTSKPKSPEQDAKPSQDFEKPLQETAKLECGKKDDAKVDHVVKEIITLPTDHSNDSLSACNVKTEVTESKKEDTFKTEQTEKVGELPKGVNPGKRALSVEKDFDASLEQKEAESFVAKRLCINQDRDELYSEKTVHIPLLDFWKDKPSESAVSASTSGQEIIGSAVNCELPDTARELRTAFILARKEQIEVAFAQDCKTFAFVANTLLKKDPSIEAAVTSALRSSLQEMAGLCVQELNTFIDRYDSGV